MGDNVSVRHDSPVCSVVFVTKQLCTQVRLLRIFWGEGSFDVGVRVRHEEGEGNALFPTCSTFFTHPGGYYGVLRSTRVVPVIFRRQISNVAVVKYKS